MTNLYSRINDYRMNNRGWLKGFIDVGELILAGISYPFAILVTKEYFIPEMEIRSLEGILFFAVILMSWFVLSRISAMAKIPRTQRYLTLAFQFARNTFIVFIGLLAVKVLFRLTSIPVLMLVIYVSFIFILNLTFRLIVFRVLKIYRYRGKSTHNVLTTSCSHLVPFLVFSCFSRNALICGTTTGLLARRHAAST